MDDTTDRITELEEDKSVIEDELRAMDKEAEEIERVEKELQLLYKGPGAHLKRYQSKDTASSPSSPDSPGRLKICKMDC